MIDHAFLQAWAWQKSLVDKVIQTSSEDVLGYIVILQHDPVYTDRKSVV